MAEPALANEEETKTEYVKLISSDGFEFTIHREAAMRSGTIKNMLSGPVQFRESLENVIPFHDIKAVILEIVCRYLYYKWQYEGSVTEIPEFKIDPEMVLETLMTADFLDC
ncbi:POZ domain-containing protein [Hesseltinella vesiculosa]|uniref:Elongin-C n=1 Tax=Hesseltinella vesiculosa TaxID=101127 RepID=A0A1X2GBA8_9FUNG|nr:POZ domain-containing protein [Hesseltinella vesiculosa]